ncbi:pyridoxamine 5'-phosphate oxidase family protein [Deinococcus sp. KNUC1210]|uniref:pyridoxamine 5'-phosphate oxidase family protein n=1 Tax=Deinococcus sp. KNUC1210 TaxID=2917691 RepID=UPI001EF15AAD|nr:pyridoxamine 5'-phosphate oxidase family protein [Deinococcus sp. KNUC1210]ULH16276.1 pyridoxamine 5'-phosphate oxidase family protein [Deinococcus sp. KNUC1210]
MSDQSLSHDESMQEIGKIIKGVKFAMVTTQNTEGHLHARPLTTQEADFSGEIWFIGSKDSGSVADIKAHDRVNVSYSDTDKGQYVSVSGVAELVEDRAKLEELWSDFYKAYFPQGIEDPNIQLIKVDASGAEFWEGDGKIKSFFHMARAAVTGKTADHQGKNETVKL